MKEAMNQLRTSLQNAPVIWKGDYPYFIHPVTDGVPRMDPEVLKAIVELTVERVDWSQIDVLLGIEAMGRRSLSFLRRRNHTKQCICKAPRI